MKKQKNKKTTQLSLNGLKSGMEMADERVSELEDKSIKLGNQKKEKKKYLKIKIKRPPGTCRTIIKSQTFMHQSPKERKCVMLKELCLNKNV